MNPYDSDFNPTDTGLFDIPEADYRKIKALNITYAKLFNRSALHVYTAMNDPDAQIIAPTYAMDQGTGFHWLALDPERFKKQVVADIDKRKNSNEYKAWAELQNGKLILKPKDIENINKMVSKLKAKRSPSAYLADGWPEKCILWHEPYYDIWCKGRIDWITADGKALCDLKKTQVASRYAFEMTIRRYDYYMQAAHYMRGFNHCMGYRPLEWVWIVSEIDPPNECNVFVADPAEIESAEVNLEYWYEQYAECLRTGEWPGYTDEVIYFSGIAPQAFGDNEIDDIEF